ncbi:hypothetical protein ACOZ4N_11215 [Halorientalis pallida]|uniref:hypothetical protein n=1 Tax=Halorientalis pallida TaxID=2479928 RepID=UPI003C6FAFFA
MRDYSVYGLTVRSPFPLPELRAADAAGDPDVLLRRESLDPVPPGTGAAGPDRRIDAEPGRCRLTYEGVGTFLVTDGERVLVDPVGPDGTSTPVCRRLLEGQVLGVVCHQRGDLVLHGSAVGVDGDAVVFLGSSGTGKSTMAAACYGAGYRLLDDDVVVLRFTDGEPTISPGVPQLKLDPETAATLGIDTVSDGGIDAFDGKVFHRTGADDPVGASPLKRCYILTDGDSVAIEPVPARRQLIELVLATYTAGLLSETDATSRNFEACSAVLERATVERLVRPVDHDALPDAVEAVVSALDTG